MTESSRARVQPLTLPRATGWRAYWRILWLLTARDLKVRYSTSALGYLWSILDPLIMSGIYWFVFTQIFHRDVGEEPYIVFLLSGLLPWMWFTGAVSDSTRAFLYEARLVRSTKIPRTIWVNRLVLSKGIEFLLSLPVLALFAIIGGAHVEPTILLFPLAIILQTVLIMGIGFIVAPLVVFFRDLERAVKLVLRFMFYATPIIYNVSNVPHGSGGVSLREIWALNPLSGIFMLYRSAFFGGQISLLHVGASIVISFALLGIGYLVFRRCERGVLKEI